MKLYNGYLSEILLENVLETLFPLSNIQKQVRFKIESKKTVIVDFVVDESIIIEFNGFRHYTKTKTIERDFLLKSFCDKNNLKLVEIPFFLQIKKRNVDFLFKDIKIFLDWEDPDYGDGFWSSDTTCVIPQDFNLVGYDIYQNILKNLNKDSVLEIEESLRIKIASGKY